MLEKDLIKILKSIPKNQWVDDDDLKTRGLDGHEKWDLVNNGTLNYELRRREGSATQNSRYNTYRLSINGEMRIQNYYERRRYNRGMFAMTLTILVGTALLVVLTVVLVVLTAILLMKS